jgi:hypothetical protein
MQRAPSLFVLLAALSAPIVFSANPGFAEELCRGHQLLSKPRSPTSCLTIAPEVYHSPDKALTAIVLPVDVSLDATPDMESRVVIYDSAGKTITSKNFSSRRGFEGYYVDHAQWSPDSQFLVFSLTSSGGHSPWSYPMWVYSREKQRFADFSDIIGGKPTLSGDFSFSGPHTVHASTWKKPADLDDLVPVTVDLAEAFAKVQSSE